ncbi:hypothetical protein BJL95_11435 [Methylomonas sp. LWB]|uniref:hypothetical protein n=1 Tax=Methylomonas sp. LWB TaxID=1905845 RepID=UPI0008D9FA61|nr:hypothetical protein [Methylomonas sp. LWB]OHX36369.1 hypothetical protein BJL95_11435 [Methylomonas sp. LWB]
MSLLSRLGAVLLGCNLSAAAAAPALGPMWLTESGPGKAAKASRGAEARGSYTEGESMDNTHGATKHLWLRAGDDVSAAGFVKPNGMPATVCLIDGAGQRRDLRAADQNGWYHVQVDLPELGFYNAYLVRSSVDAGVLDVNVAKAELLKGTCCVKNANDELTRTAINSEAPLELVRTHLPEEGLFTRLSSGDTLNFTVLANGKPRAGATVTMITQQGWKKSAIADGEGRVSFTLIRDYFPSWNDFQRRHQETFLVVAEHEEQTAGGALNGERYSATRYRATLSGNYYPSSADYRSYAIGLGVGLFVVAFGGLAIFLFRRRRLKPYREVRFHESY